MSSEEDKRPRGAAAKPVTPEPKAPEVATATGTAIAPGLGPVRNPKNLMEGLEVNFLSSDPLVARKHYFAQLKADCPMSTLAAGMITLHKQTYRFDDQGGQVHTRGQVYALTQDELDWALKSLQMRICRPSIAINDKGERSVQGCQDILWATWKDGVLVRFPTFAAEPGDHPWTKYVVLREMTPDDVKMLEQVGTPVSPVKDAMAANERDEDEMESLAAVGGPAARASQTARRSMRAAGVMGRD